MPRRLTTDEFVSRAKAIYGNKYDYSKTIYRSQKYKVRIICPQHGEFSILPNNFLHGHKCPTCSNRQRITQSVFIERSNIIHKGRYDYSKVVYERQDKPVKIICPIHGVFLQKPEQHLSGCGCQKCFATPKSNTKEFISKAKKIYGNKYDYSKVEYTGNKNKVTIICPKHGEWQVTPNNFLRGSECPGCFGTPKHTKEEFIKMARKVHGNKYDYSKVEYDGLKEKVRIICPVHGEFFQTAGSHVRGSGCPKCVNFVWHGRTIHPEYRKLTKEIFVKRSKETHSTNYGYSKVEYKGYKEKVCIICPEHGEFWQNPKYHMRGGNCPKCVGGAKLTNQDFIAKANKVHKKKYDYKKINYINYSTKVCIICPEHGEFWQTPNNHLFGAGCPTCPQSNMEGEVRNFLLKNKIAFEQEKGFDWLRYKKKLFLDFYLPEFNAAIECQGGQHFYPVGLFGGEKYYLETLERDEIKNNSCYKRGIKIYYYSRTKADTPYYVYKSLNALLKDIKENK